MHNKTCQRSDAPRKPEKAPRSNKQIGQVQTSTPNMSEAQNGVKIESVQSRGRGLTNVQKEERHLDGVGTKKVLKK